MAKTERSASTCSAISIGDELEQIGELIDNYDGDEAYELLQKIENHISEEQRVDFLLKKSQAAYIVYNTMDYDMKKERINVIKEGLSAAKEAHEKESENLEVLKQCAVLSGTLAENSSLKDKVQLGFQFKNYLDDALKLDGNDFSLLHMRGRFLHQLAGLSWIEKTAAAVVFGKLPEANQDLALRDLLKAEEQMPTAIDNLLYIGKCYKAKGEKTKAVAYLRKVIASEAVDTVDDEQIDEAKELLKGF